MTTQFALDVYLARIKSGDTQSDVAHLLDISRVTISRFERGNSEPSLQDILALSLVYGRSFESFFADKLRRRRQRLLKRLQNLQPLTQPTTKHANREANLQRLARRLEADLAINDWA